LADSLADQAKGGQGNHIRGFSCEPYGMPMMTLAFWPQEYVITAETTHILINHQAHTRRIYTDGATGRPRAGADLRRLFDRQSHPTYQSSSQRGSSSSSIFELRSFSVLSCRRTCSPSQSSMED